MGVSFSPCGDLRNVLLEHKTKRNIHQQRVNNLSIKEVGIMEWKNIKKIWCDTIMFIASRYNPGSLQMPDQISSDGTQKTNSFTRALSYNIIIKHMPSLGRKNVSHWNTLLNISKNTFLLRRIYFWNKIKSIFTEHIFIPSNDM